MTCEEIRVLMLSVEPEDADFPTFDAIHRHVEECQACRAKVLQEELTPDDHEIYGPVAEEYWIQRNSRN